jgi:hypothetical protein
MDNIFTYKKEQCSHKFHVVISYNNLFQKEDKTLNAIQ